VQGLLRVLDLSRIESSGVVAQIEHHAELASTNDRAVELAARDEVRLPLLVVADRQTAGRGRGANRWWSAAGALTFSLLVETSDASLSPEKWPQFSLTAGLAICEALARHAPQRLWGLKWPNDVFVDERKICGILIEAPSAARRRLVIGIGINVNNSFRNAPAELTQRATALCDVIGHELDSSAVLLDVLRALQRRWQMLGLLGFGALVEDWRRYCILDGRTVTLVQGHERIVGHCLGIDDTGRLILQTETHRRTCVAGSIEKFE
jgi:BirA family biotin operon repressor/biotin-[acetyl-CoA-carboxylase] ligase